MQTGQASLGVRFPLAQIGKLTESSLVHREAPTNKQTAKQTCELEPQTIESYIDLARKR